MQRLDAKTLFAPVMSGIAGLRWAANIGLRAFATLQLLLQPWVSLFIRIWLAQAFLVQQVRLSMDPLLSSRLSAPFGGGWWSDLEMHVARSGPGAALQAIFPLLLIAGLLSRPSALALLLAAVMAPIPAEDEATRPFCIALLIWLSVCGPGRISIDHLLSRGLRQSAFPGATIVIAGYERFSRVATSPMLLALRLWLAAAPAAIVLPAMMSPVHPILPRVPAMVGLLPHWMDALCATMLAVGFGVRPIGLLLLALVPLGSLMTLSDDRFYWALTLLALVTSGAGVLSLDGLFSVLARRMRPLLPLKKLPHVVIVGAGFGGVAAAKGLARARCRITLIDQRNFTLFQPLLYQVATAGLSPAEIATPIRSLFRTQENLRVMLGRVTGAAPAERLLHMAGTTIGYDMLVLATGARHSYSGHDDWAELAPGLKSIEDATAIRHRLLSAFEQAENSDDPAARSAWLTFVIVGGGPTGVELAGAVIELARQGLQGEFRRADPALARVILVQSASRLLPSFPKRLSDDAAHRLEALGVEVQLNRKLEEVTSHFAVVNGERILTKTVLWAAGVMASDAASWVGAKADRAGRLEAAPDLSVPGSPDIFVIGDTAASNAWAGKPVPGLAPAAKQGGVHVARIIRDRLAGRTTLRPFRYRHYGSLATIGRKAAIAEFGPLRFTGALAWWIWGAVHIALLAGGRNRTTVLLQWFWAYITFRRGTRLITGPAL